MDRIKIRAHPSSTYSLASSRERPFVNNASSSEDTTQIGAAEECRRTRPNSGVENSNDAEKAPTVMMGTLETCDVAGELSEDEITGAFPNLKVQAAYNELEYYRKRDGYEGNLEKLCPVAEGRTEIKAMKQW